MKIDIVSADHTFELENRVNEHLTRLEKYYTIRDIKYSVYKCGYGATHCAMIICEEK